MARYPGVWKEISRHRTPMRSYRAVVLHVAAVEADSLYGYFNRPGNPTSHFYVRYNGTVEQYVDTRYQAPAQLEGNPTCIGIETEGLGSGLWTNAQLGSLGDLCRWLHKTHGIPLQPMPDSKSTSKGIGIHRLGIEPWRLQSGERWSNHYAKTCPGDKRISQVEEVIQLATLTEAEIGFIKRTYAALSALSDSPYAALAEAVKLVQGKRDLPLAALPDHGVHGAGDGSVPVHQHPVLASKTGNPA